MLINIDSKELIVFTNKLDKIHRAALPNAIRNTLNSAAFDVKTNTMPESADDTFVNRKPNFFKANSRVETAKGFSIKDMESVVGFTSKNSTSDNAVDDLEEQEYGGTIEGRSFIPMDTARGGNNSKPVRPGNRLSKVKNIVNSNTIAGTNPKQQFIHAVSKAGKGGYVIGNNTKKTLFRVDDYDPVSKKFKLKALFSYSKGRDVKVKETKFMRKASLKTAEKLDDFYIKHAEKQIEKYL